MGRRQQDDAQEERGDFPIKLLSFFSRLFLELEFRCTDPLGLGFLMCLLPGTKRIEYDEVQYDPETYHPETGDTTTAAYCHPLYAMAVSNPNIHLTLPKPYGYMYPKLRKALYRLEFRNWLQHEAKAHLLCACRPFVLKALFLRKAIGMTSFAFLRLIAFLHAGQLPLPRSLFFSDAMRARVRHSWQKM
jgi:hypothetical protein